MIDFDRVNPIQYEFLGGKKTSNPLNGLRDNGPVDLETRGFANVEMSFLCPQGAKPKIQSFADSLSDSFKDLFRINDVSYDIIPYSESNFQQKIVDKNLVQSPKNSKSKKIILHYHDYYKDRYDAPYYQVKREILGKGLPTQGLLRENFKFKSFYFNNIACGIYAKLGGRPWTISGVISELFREDTIYIGFDVSRKKYEKAIYSGPGCVVVYDEKGQYVYHFTENFPINNDAMEHDVAKNLMEMTIARVTEKKKRNPKNIVFMRDGDIPQSEVQGFQDALKGKKTSLHIIEVRKRGNIPILMKKDNKFMLSDSGTFMKIKTGNKYKPYDLFIQNLGNDINLPSMPRALKITPYLLNPINDSTEEYMKDIMRQIFVLSNLNWSYLRGRISLPVVVHYAHEAANLMRNGVNPKNIDAMALWML